MAKPLRPDVEDMLVVEIAALAAAVIVNAGTGKTEKTLRDVAAYRDHLLEVFEEDDE